LLATTIEVFHLYNKAVFKTNVQMAPQIDPLALAIIYAISFTDKEYETIKKKFIAQGAIEFHSNDFKTIFV
jgi:hypothetical protein